MTSPSSANIKRIHPNVWVLSLASFLTDVSSEMIANLLPLFLFNILGVRTTFIGLIEGVAETTASLVKIFSGSLSDRMKKRKMLTILGYTLSTLAKPFLYLANSWTWVLGVRFTDRVGKGIRTAPRDALLAESVQSTQRGFAFGLHRAGDTAGAFTGLGIAAAIIWFNQSGSALLTRSTFQVIILASIIPAALAVLVLVLGLREISPQGKDNPENAKIQSKERKLDKRFVIFLIIIVLFTLGNSSDAFIILRSQERGLSVMEILGMLLTFNAIYSLLSGPAGSLSDRIGRRQLMVAGWLVYALVYIGFATAQNGTQIWALFAIYGIYYALTEGVAKALIADFIQKEQLGLAFGLFNGAIGLTALPASFIAGVLWQGIGNWGGFGASAPFYFGALMALLAGSLLMITNKKRASLEN